MGPKPAPKAGLKRGFARVHGHLAPDSEGTRRPWRTGLLLGLGLALVGAPARAAEPDADTRLSCRREPMPGRVLCELEIEVPAGRLAWADVLIQRAPEFARPLRARVGPRSAAGGSARRLRLPLALAATRTGSGELGVKVRFVACQTPSGGVERCSPRSRMVATRVDVGALEMPKR
ncbi:MAG: hypothetical protein U0263_38300 [Polyangiaceae bacterium]